jgi:hypothetical protein
MRWPAAVRYPTPEGLAPLLAAPGVRSWYLQERFQPQQPSVSLQPPAPAFTPAVESSLGQWLIEAPAAAGLRLDSGLLAWRRQWLYELNPANAPVATRDEGSLSLAPWRLLARRLAGGWCAPALPPGWWQKQRSPLRLGAPLVLLSSHNNPNYFHWATQPGLAPLFLQEHFGLPPLQDAAIALSHRRSRPLPTYVEPLLELLAPDLPRHVAPALASASTCRLALQAHASSVVVSPRQLHWWRQRLKHVLSPVPRPWRRLLLSRRQARNRRCCNEDQLLAALTPLGFERVDLEQRSVQDQWQLFAEAAIVMGVHGAGFTNLVACQPGALVVELVPDQGPYSHYYLMASALGLRHGHLIGKPLDPTSTNFLVDPARLFELLGVLGVGDPA